MDHRDRSTPAGGSPDPGGRQHADVLDGGHRRPGWRSRRLPAVATALLVAGLLAGGLDLRERRAQTSAERRAAAAVELVLLEDSRAGASSTPQGGSLSVQLGLRNDGPREVEVAGATWAGYALVSPVRVAAGDERRLLLRQEVDCAAGRPAPLEVGSPVELQVRTASRIRTVQLELHAAPTDAAEAGRSCGFVPLEEAVLVLGQRQALDGDALGLQLDLAVQGRTPVELVSLDAGPGLAAVLRDHAGLPVQLPVTLASAGGRTSAMSTHEVAVIVTDCAAARGVPAEVGLVVRTGDREGSTADVVLSYEPELRAGLLAASCAG